MTTTVISEQTIESAEDFFKEIDELKSTINRLRQEAITTKEEIKKWCKILSVTFFEGDAKRQQEGYFEIFFDYDTNIIIGNLKAKDLLKFSAFQKKVLSLTGRLLPDVEQSAWTLFLSQQLDSSLPVRG